MDATTTVEMELQNPDYNFFVKKQFSYGEITIALFLLTIIFLMLWQIARGYKKR